MRLVHIPQHQTQHLHLRHGLKTQIMSVTVLEFRLRMPEMGQRQVFK